MDVTHHLAHVSLSDSMPVLFQKLLPAALSVLGDGRKENILMLLKAMYNYFLPWGRIYSW